MKKIQQYLTLDQNLPILLGGMIITVLVIAYVGWQVERGAENPNHLSVIFRRDGFFRADPSGTTNVASRNNANVRMVSNPSEPVPAGTLILVDNFSLMVENRYELVGNDIMVFVVIQNLSDKPHLFRYRNSSLVLKDNLHNIYRQTPKEHIISAVKQLSFGPGEILSMDPTCHDTLYKLPQCIPRYVGPIKAEATKILVKFEELGPFDEVVVEIDL